MPPVKMTVNIPKVLLIFIIAILFSNVILNVYSIMRTGSSSKSLVDQQNHATVPDVPPWLATYEGEMIEEQQIHRKMVLSRFCNSTSAPQKLSRPLDSNMYVDDKKKVLYCMIPRSTSTFWMQILLSTNSTQNLPDQPHEIPEAGRNGVRHLEHYDKKEQERILSTYYRFLVVRHPLLRLVSAYNMFKAFSKMPEKQRRANDIINKLMKNKDGVNKFPTFENFAKQIATKWNTIPQARNPHWDDYGNLCQPCQVKYDFIARSEYLIPVDEMNYILRKVGSPLSILSKDRSLHWSSTVYLFHSLSKSTQMAIMKRYANDFKMFNYNTNMRNY